MYLPFKRSIILVGCIVDSSIAEYLNLNGSLRSVGVVDVWINESVINDRYCVMGRSSKIVGFHNNRMM